ncbi:MAG: DUF4145 domain-containing protein [Bdellovibrio sp.]|nr:DUF4145 domain-containing protein [Bdellovibrio sp.]
MIKIAKFPHLILPGYNTGMFCPHCNQGFLSSATADFHTMETKRSKNDRAEKEADCEDQMHLFSTLLICQNCSDCVTTCGYGKMAPDPNPDNNFPKPQYTLHFRPLFFYPTIHLFEVPTKVPEKVKINLLSSFSLFWSEPDACINKLRVSIEHLLDSFHIKKKLKDKHGKQVFLSTGARIDLFRKKYKTSARKDVASKLNALKWMGNIGSHRGGTKQKDAWKVYEIMEVVLKMLYESHDSTIERRVRTINKTKGRSKRI